MKNSQVRPRRENGRKITTMGERNSKVTQLQLAQIQQLQSDLVGLQEQLRKEWNTVRMQLLRGVAVEPGPIRAFLRRSGDAQKLIVK